MGPPLRENPQLIISDAGKCLLKIKIKTLLGNVFSEPIGKLIKSYTGRGLVEPFGYILV